MNKFELFTIIYYWLDNFYKDSADEMVINQISDMNPFVWEELTSADPAVYEEYNSFIKDKNITIENSLLIASEYAATIEYADVTEAFRNADNSKWEKGVRNYLSSKHKGEDLSD